MQRVFDPRTGALMYKAPNPEAFGFDWEPLKSAVADMDRLAGDLERTVAKIRELHDAQRDAETKDRQAFATAIKEGKKDPGTKHADKRAADIRNAERRREALKVAITEQAAAITTTIDEHRSEWQQQVGSRIPKAQDRLSRAVAEVEAARGELQGLHGLVDWLTKPDQSYAPKDAAKNTNVIVKGGINRQGGEPTLASIRREAESA